MSDLLDFLESGRVYLELQNPDSFVLCKEDGWEVGLKQGEYYKRTDVQTLAEAMQMLLERKS